MAWVLKLHRQSGTLEEPGYISPHVAVGTTATGNWGPWHDYSKVSLSPCHGSLCKFPHSHETQILVNYLRTQHNQNRLGVGHGGDNQQQHILIVISNPQNLEVNLHKSKVWEAAPPVPSNSNNWPRGWICRARSSQNWALILDTWVPKSIKAVTSCLSTTTSASLECPTKCTIASGFRNGKGATSCHPLFLAAFIRVSFGLVSGRECCEFIDCCWWGVWLHSLSSPHPCLMSWLE